MKFGIVIGSVRQGRLGASVGAWVAERARALDASAVPGGVEWDVLDRKDFDLPVMTDENWAQAEGGLGGVRALTDHHDRSLDKVLRRLVDLTRAITGDRAVTGS